MKTILKYFTPLLIILGVVAIFTRCSTPAIPIDRLTRTFQNYPEYYVVLDDMKEEGNFFTNYFHKYKVVQPDVVTTTDWNEVPKPYYMSNLPYLGMAILSVKDGVVEKKITPPGYYYVGNRRYGSWHLGPSGSYWAFNNRYRRFSDTWGPSYTVTKLDYDNYKSSYSKNIPYFGNNKAFGTEGTIVKKTRPSFFQRRMAREKQKKMSFSQKVSHSIGRSRSSFRGRGGGLGK